MSVDHERPDGLIPDIQGPLPKPTPLESPNWARFDMHDFTEPVELGEYEAMPDPKRKPDGRGMDYVVITRIGQRYVVIPTGADRWYILDTDRKGFSNSAVVAWKELEPPTINPDTPPLSSPNWDRYVEYGVSPG